MNKREINQVIFQSLSQRTELRETLKALQELVGVAIAVFDLDMRVICVAETYGEELWLELIKKSLINTDNPFNSPKMRTLLNTDESLIFCTGEDNGMPFAIRRMMSNGIPEGFVAVVFENEQKEAALYLAEAITHLYCYLHGRSDKGEKGDNFLKCSLANILLKNTNEISDLIYAIYGCESNSSYDLSPGYVMLEVCVRPGTGIYRLRSFEKALSSVWHNAFSYFHQNGLRIIICVIDMMREQMDGFWSQLRSLCKQHGVYCGASLVFTDLNDRISYLQQAKTALQLGMAMDPDTFLFSAEKYYYYILAANAIDVHGADILILSDVSLLLEYDNKKQTQYLETLEKYVHHFGMISPSASALFIDRSTLKYRIQKISDILNRDLNDIRVIRSLRFSIAVYRVNQILKCIPGLGGKEDSPD